MIACKWLNQLSGASVLIASCAFVALASRPAAAQTINTYAGGGTYVDSPPLSVAMKPAGLAVGPAGGIYVDVRSYNPCDDGCGDTDEDNEVFRIDPATGTVTRVVGNGIDGAAGIGGSPRNVSLHDPRGLTFDDSGNLYIADAGNNRILKVSADPAFDPANPTALAGGPITARSVVSVFSTSFTHPVSLAFDASFSNLYVATTENGLAESAFSGVTKINLSDGTMTVVAGCLEANTTGCSATPVSGSPATAIAIWPEDGGNDLAFDSAGNLYIAATVSQVDRVLRVNTSDDVMTIVAGPESSTNGVGCRQPGTAGSVSLGYLSIAFDGAGNLLLGDQVSERVCRVSPDPATGTIDSNSPIVSIAGGGSLSQFAQYGQPGYGDGDAASDAVFVYLDGMAVDHAGNVFVSDGTEQRVRKISVDPATGVADGGSTISTAAGAGAYAGGDGNTATAATMNEPFADAVDGRGDLFIASDGVIRRVDAKTGIISTFAGHLGPAPASCPSSQQDGEAATCANLTNPGPYGLAVDSAGNVYVANFSTVQRIDASGAITTVAGGGSGSAGCGDGGPAIHACLFNVHGLAVDQLGDLYIADTGDNEIREVTTDGTIRTIAGTGQTAAATDCDRYHGVCPGDGTPAIDASLNPIYLVWSPTQRLAVQRDQQAPMPIAVGGGTLYVTDAAHDAIRLVDLYTDDISTLQVPWYCINDQTSNGACNGTSGDQYQYGVLLGTCGLLCGLPNGIAMDAAGNLFVSTTMTAYGGNAIWEIPTPQFVAPSINPWASTLLEVIPSSHATDRANPFGILAGDGGPSGYASVSSPQTLAIDSKGNLYVTDQGFHRIRLIQGVARASGDVNGDGKIDKLDIGLVTQALNTPANGPYDPRDLNHDGVINLLDARILVTLCTFPGCATSP